MIRCILVCTLAILAACSAPSPYFMGTKAGVFETGGMRFTVYQRADEVEVHRTGGGIPRERDVWLGAIRAIERVTGCSVRPRSMEGDQSIVTAEVDCVV
jgi:hypothetical protein